MYNYEDWSIWKKGIEIAEEIYKIGSLLPVEERYRLRSQISKSSVEISSNIMEGTVGRTLTDFHRCLVFALGSAYECETQLLMIKENRLIEDNIIDKGIKNLNEFEEMIMGVIIHYHCQGNLIREYLNRSYN